MAERCFVALTLPAEIRRALIALQPAGEGLRRVPEEQLHLTLHFLGPADVAVARAALESVALEPLPLTLTGTGAFAHRHGGALWVGVRLTDGLTALHQRVGEALATTGYTPSSRPFHPHLTVARWKRGRAPRAFLDQAVPPLAFQPDALTLFTSELTPSGAVHRVAWRHELPR